MKLLICGDLSVTSESRPAFERSDARAAFGDVCDLFASADRTIVNLECALTDSENRIIKCGPNLKGPKTTADTMLAAGVNRRRTLVIALLTGVIEVVGTLIGYFAVSLSTAILPFALAFAAGTMLYVISDEMIPETHAHGHERAATYALLVGFCLMLTFDFFLG